MSSPLADKSTNTNEYLSFMDDTIDRIEQVGLEHRDRHKNCVKPIHKPFLLYTIIRLLELIFAKRRADQVRSQPKPLQHLSALIDPPTILFECLNECQINEITYRIKLFDKFRSELMNYQRMLDNNSTCDLEALRL